MRTVVWLVAIAGCGSFELHATVAADQQTAVGKLTQHGAPFQQLVIDQTFGDFGDATRASITFEVDDADGPHTFDLHPFLAACDQASIGALDREDLEFLLTYSSTCVPVAPAPSTELALCFDGAKCTGSAGTFNEVP